MKKPIFRTLNKIAFLLFLTGVVLGLFLTAQWKAKPSRVTSPVIPYTSLRETRDILQAENEELKNQIAGLQNQINQTQGLLKKGRVVSSMTLEQLERLKTEVALTPAVGNGVKIVLADSPTGPASEETIVHAADLRDLMNLLWGSGATAISINNQRISAFTSIDCIVNTILINNVRLTSPFEIKAIGNQNQMLKNLKDEGILSDLHRRKSLGLIFEVSKSNRLELPAYNGSYNISFAEVVP